MINAMIFDLDGTLVQTERLKALSYARALLELCSDNVTEAQVIEAFRDVVGLSRRQVAARLLAKFSAEGAAKQHAAEFGVHTPWQAFIQIRLRYYESMVADPQVLRDNQWPHNMALLESARRADCKVGLATMSHCQQVQHVLKALELTDSFDFIATRDDVEQGKPDPEIYLLTAQGVGVPASQCLVIEDSPTGVQAALNAGMWCIAVATPFTRKKLYESNLLDQGWIVDDPKQLPTVLEKMLAERLAER